MSRVTPRMQLLSSQNHRIRQFTTHILYDGYLPSFPLLPESVISRNSPSSLTHNSLDLGRFDRGRPSALLHEVRRSLIIK
jgi:hypothetical protein